MPASDEATRNSPGIRVASHQYTDTEKLLSLLAYAAPGPRSHLGSLVRADDGDPQPSVDWRPPPLVQDPMLSSYRPNVIASEIDVHDAFRNGPSREGGGVDAHEVLLKGPGVSVLGRGRVPFRIRRLSS